MFRNMTPLVSRFVWGFKEEKAEPAPAAQAVAAVFVAATYAVAESWCVEAFDALLSVAAAAAAAGVVRQAGNIHPL
jgi:hypothetical protein